MKQMMMRIVNFVTGRKPDTKVVEEAKHTYVHASEKRKQERRNKHIRRHFNRVRRMQDGILTQIRKANSEMEINLLLIKGNTFQQATDETRRKWQKAKTKRLAELA